MIKVLSCNVRVSGAKDGDNSWPFRKDICAEIIKKQKADLIGFQEMTDTQFAALSLSLPEYKSYGLTDAAIGTDPVNCIFYNPNRFQLLFASGYWLSETPHIPCTKSWQSAYVRLANWVRLRDKQSGNEFRYINTHLDNVSLLAREMQAKLIVADANSYPHDYPQILTGDMNEDFTFQGIKAFKDGGWIDTYESIHSVPNPGHTYHGYKGEDYIPDMGKMDFIFTRGQIKPLRSEIIKDTINNRYPSDHYFVSAQIELL